MTALVDNGFENRLRFAKQNVPVPFWVPCPRLCVGMEISRHFDFEGSLPSISGHNS